jgi:ketosteroid isomerase-like protein
MVVEVGYTFGADPASPGATLAYPSMKYVVVYKRQADGSLRLLVDTSNSMPAPATGVDAP